MKAVNIFQALRRTASASRTQPSQHLASGPTVIAHELLGFIAGGKGERPAPTTGPSLPKGTW